MSHLAGQTVLVTGASAGIGAACATVFAEAGARVILAARRLEQLEQLASGLPGETLVLQMDVADRPQVEERLGSLPPAWREVDILINNAGLARGLTKLQELEPDDWEEMLATNVNGLLQVTRALLPGMLERGRGHVINIGSIAGHQVYPGGNVYCATKHAVKALTDGLRMDLLGTGVRVSSVDPGLVETEFSLVRFRGDRERAAAVYAGLEALTGTDIAEAVLFCATRPPRVNIAEMIVFPSAQASAMLTHREE